MGLKYWDEKSGEFKEVALPYLKGDKGDTPEGVVSATPNSIPQRNANGNLFTGQTLGFESANGTFLGGVHITEDGWLKHSVPNTGLADIHTSVTLPVESGTFTPKLIGSNGGEGTHTEQRGFYYRIGNLVHFQLVVRTTGHNISGQCRVGGLPFRASSSAGYSSVNIGWFTGFATWKAEHQITGYVAPGVDYINFAFQSSHNATATTILTTGHMTEDRANYIALSGAYIVD